MKKGLAIILSLAMILAACGTTAPPASPPPAASTQAPANDAGSNAADTGDIYVSVISKGFQHQFWQAVNAGAQAAAEEYGIEIFFGGPPSESDIQDQVNMFNSELAKNPNAIALAALSTDAVLSQLQEAYDRNIPVVGFDSGVPDAPAGQVLANASTNNVTAAAVGADNMFPAIKDKIAAATPDSKVVIAVLSQDATSESITGRTRGFVEKLAELARGVNDSVAITGGLASVNTGDTNSAVVIEVVIGATANIGDMTNAANTIFNMPGLIGIFCSNEGAVGGLLAAYGAGTAIPDGVVIVGFDAGAQQKSAVESGIFMGSVTQDPFQIGYQAVSLAMSAMNGESVSDVDTGARWWDASNMNDPDIALLLYD